MKTKIWTGRLSSHLASVPALVLWLCLAGVFSLSPQSPLSGFFLFLFLLCLGGRLWGRLAMEKVEVSLSYSAARLFPGESAVITYTIANPKLLPLVWLELSQAISPTRCLMPREEGLLEELPADEAREQGSSQILRKKFSFLLWHQSLSWDSVWEARRRGVFGVEEVTLRSGDGFGLTQTERIYTLPQRPTFVVYPALQPVAVELFLNRLWGSHWGSKGFYEDPSVLRGLKTYQSTDAWKRINWRMAARQEELQVNQYEMILPQGAHFILDGQSFPDDEAGAAALEDSISLTASLLLALEGSQIRCGLSLPDALEAPGVNLCADESASVPELLYFLAGYRPIPPDPPQATPFTTDEVVHPSRFQEGELLRRGSALGHFYYILYDAAAPDCNPFPGALAQEGVTVFSYLPHDPPPASPLSELPVLPFAALKQEVTS